MPTIKLVQSGSVSISTFSTGSYQSITAVDMSASFLVTSYQCSANTANDGFLTGDFVNDSLLQFRTWNAGNSTTKEVCWYVIEFVSGSGVIVERGSDQFPGPSTTNPLDISLSRTFNTGSSFPVSSFRNVGTLTTADDSITHKLGNGGNNLYFASTQADPNGDGPVVWQAVEHSSCIIQTGSIVYSNSDTAVIESINSVNLDKTLLMLSSNCSSSAVGTWGSIMWIGNFDSSTQLRFQRSGSLGADADGELQYYVVEFTDGTSVQRGTMNFSAGTAILSSSITPVQKNRSFIWLAGTDGTRGTTDYTADDQIGCVTYTNRYSGSTASAVGVQIGRQNTSGNSTIVWQNVEFPSPSSPTFIKIID